MKGGRAHLAEFYNSWANMGHSPGSGGVFGWTWQPRICKLQNLLERVIETHVPHAKAETRIIT
jgi:hypothetical protein